MKLRNAFFTTVLSAGLVNGACNSSNNETFATNEHDSIPLAKPEQVEDGTASQEFLILDDLQNKTKKQISICLVQDENSHTYTGTLESITDPEHTILEFPVSHLFQKYGNRPHPLAVRGVDKNFTSLLGEYGIEELSDSIPQKLSPRREKITSETQYETGDTLRFSLIDPFLQGIFPQNLSDQLKEDGFETFSDSDASDLNKKIQENQNFENVDKKSDFIYDIVVKRLSSGGCVLGVYRDGELFMATYVSVGLNGRKTKTGQFTVLSKNPYYFSRKYKSPMPDGLQFDEEGFWFHQGKIRSRSINSKDINHESVIIRGLPASHGCVRLPGIYALSLYSLVKDKKHVDVFISKNLYN